MENPENLKARVDELQTELKTRTRHWAEDSVADEEALAKLARRLGMEPDSSPDYLGIQGMVEMIERELERRGVFHHLPQGE